MSVNIDVASRRLADAKSELQALSDMSSESRSTVMLDQQSVGRLSRMDAMQQQAMNQAAERSRQIDLTRIQAAIARLRDGEYGYCVDCGDEIPDGRLAIDPMAERCVACASA